MPYSSCVGIGRWALLCGAATVLAACSISPRIGETFAQCSDGEDNDLDGFTDCRDTDCHALGECSARALSRDDQMPASPGEIGDAYVSEPRDASVPEPPPPRDAAVEPPPDSGPIEPPPDAAMEGCAVTGCDENQKCVDNVCVDDPLVVVELWDVTHVEAYAPRALEVGSGKCLDTACFPSSGGLLFPRCTCAPDPQVQFWVDLDPTDSMEAELAGETDPEQSAEEAEWSMPGVTLRVLPTSEVLVKLVDYDIDSVEPILECTISGALVMAGGRLECTARFPAGGEIQGTFFVRADVAPTQVTPE